MDNIDEWKINPVPNSLYNAIKNCCIGMLWCVERILKAVNAFENILKMLIQKGRIINNDKDCKF